MDIGEVESVDDLLLAFFSVSRKGEEAGANSVSFSTSTMSDLFCGSLLRPLTVDPRWCVMTKDNSFVGMKTNRHSPKMHTAEESLLWKVHVSALGILGFYSWHPTSPQPRFTTGLFLATCFLSSAYFIP